MDHTMLVGIAAVAVCIAAYVVAMMVRRYGAGRQQNVDDADIIAAIDAVLPMLERSPVARLLAEHSAWNDNDTSCYTASPDSVSSFAGRVYKSDKSRFESAVASDPPEFSDIVAGYINKPGSTHLDDDFFSASFFRTTQETLQVDPAALHDDEHRDVRRYIKWHPYWHIQGDPALIHCVARLLLDAGLDRDKFNMDAARRISVTEKEEEP